MSSFEAGKVIFANRREYPLPEIQGTKDFAFFHFRNSKDNYKDGALNFFKKFYRNHNKRTNINSLQDLIDKLHSFVIANGISHIREIVIICHASPLALIFPILNNTSNTNLSEYRYLSAGSLSILQDDFLNGKFPDFNNKRKELITRMTEDTWITIRACRFGRSQTGLYALHAFFGGRANVYAPKVYQYFGSNPIALGNRIETHAGVHKHLVNQRFFPGDFHTPDRKDAIVRFLADPGHFSDPVKLLTVDFNNANSPDTIAYEGILDQLNLRTISDPLRTLLSDQAGFTLNKPKVVVNVRDSRWTIKDILDHQTPLQDVEKIQIKYHLEEQIFVDEASLEVEAQIELTSSQSSFTIQAFFDEYDNNEYHALMFPLAFYSDDDDTQENENRFTAVWNLLKSGPLFEDPAGELDLFSLFKEHDDIDLTEGSASLTLDSQKGAGVNRFETWLLQDVNSYLIKVVHPYRADGVREHKIGVYRHMDKKTESLHQLEALGRYRIGTDPDHPGTELLAYLDRLSFDELVALIDFLRHPYRAENAIYLHQAIESIKRKSDYFTWYEDLPEIKAARLNQEPLIDEFFPYTNLSGREKDDKDKTAYHFIPDEIWADVKASNPRSDSFQDDLFLEQPLNFSAKDLVLPEELESDSPFTDIESLREIEKQRLEEFYEAEKLVLDSADQIEDISCGLFEIIIKELKKLEGKTEEEIRDALHTTKVTADKTLFEALWDFYQKYVSTPLDVLDIIEGDGAIPEIVINWVVKKMPKTGVILQSRLFTYLNRAWPYVAVAMWMGTHYLEDLAFTLKADEDTGKRTAFRQYARALQSFSAQNADNFPLTVNLDMAQYVADLRASIPGPWLMTNEYWIALYRQDQYETDHVVSTVIPLTDKMKKGFDDGVKLIEKNANELLAKADQIIDSALYQSGFDACKIQVLRDNWIIDPGKTRAVIMRQFAATILRKVPKV